MTPVFRLRQVSVAAMVLLAVVLVPKVLFPDAHLYTRVLTPTVLPYILSPIKLAFLILAGLFAARSAATFEPSNPARPAWILLAVGLFGYAGGQAVLAFYQMVRMIPTPFPSLADPLFVTATLLLIVALTSFVVVYRRAGYPVGSLKEVFGIALLALLLVVVLVVWVLRPVLDATSPWVEQTLNVGYPVLDCFLLVPTLLLLRMAFQLRGGSLVKVWMTLLVGFLCLSLGDILFAFLTTLEIGFVDPLVDLAFGCSYILMAWATANQHEILAR